MLIRRRGWDKDEHHRNQTGRATVGTKRASTSSWSRRGICRFPISLDRLRGMGMSVQVFEEPGTVLAASGIGIVTLGLASILPGPMYQFFARRPARRGWKFSELYPSWQEIRAYFRYVDEKLGLSQDIRFNRRVAKAEFDPAHNRWTVRSSDGSVTRARYFVLCTGLECEALCPGAAGALSDVRWGAPSYARFGRSKVLTWPASGSGSSGQGRAACRVARGSRQHGSSPHRLPAHA